MKPVLRRILLLTAAVYLILGLSPLVLRFAVSGHAEPPPAASPTPAADESPDAVQTGTFRILDTGTGEILTVSDADFLRGVLFEGGDVDLGAILKVSTDGGNGLAELYGPTRFQAAAEAGAEVLKGGSLTEFEKLCDDAVGDYLAGAQMVPFGEAPLLGYLAARETEYTNLRILLLGRSTGLPADVIRSRLRASYV